ncbi:MAG: SDR family NAD(P)-dependent oxidoreductase, partial [Pseudooceanicola sp.]|nr:SDR family NAD(P)-dependent oxidoreductase [Pseudooceanicola sp.]
MSKTIIITGGGSGIGRACAETFLADGWRVALLGRRADALEESAKGNANALILPCDVTDEAQVDAAFDRAMAEWGHLDAVFNNAGVSMAGKPIDEMAVSEWRKVIDINLNGAFIVARAAFARMRKQSPQGGRIIN